MKKSAGLKIGAVVLVCAVLGSLQGMRLESTRQTEAFYRWIRAAAVGDRFGWSSDSSGDVSISRVGDEESIAFEASGYVDEALFQKVAAKAKDSLGVHDREGEKVGEHTPTRLALHADNIDSSGVIWDIAKSPILADERNEFLDLVRDRRLGYARNIDYAKMVEGEIGMFQMFLGFRKVAANFIWLEVDRLWHGGVIHRMIPLMKTCVLLDPQFVDAYLLGSWHLAYNVTAKMQETPNNQRVWNERHQACIGLKNQYYYFATDFLRDGITHNEHDYRIYFDLGFGIYKEKLKDYPNSVKYLEQAVRQRHDIWVPRQLYICYELNGQYEKALEGWKEYMLRFPDTNSGSDTAPRRIKRILGLEYERRAELALAEAEAATDPAVAEAKRAEAEANIVEAQKKWREIEEPFAEARSLRLDAKEAWERERYVEAIAMLDQARYVDLGDDNFFTCSNMIIDIKLDAGMELTLSEKKAVARKETEDRCIGEPIF